MTHHNCGQCAYLRRTSPGQVFLLCTFWAAESMPVKGAAGRYGYDYMIAHCHMQPEALACPFFKPREMVKDAAIPAIGYAHENALLPAT